MTEEEKQQGNEGNEGNENGYVQIFQKIFQMIIIYWVIKYFFFSNTTPSDSTSNQFKGRAISSHENLWQINHDFSIYVFLSEMDNWNIISSDQKHLYWSEENLLYNWDKSNYRSIDLSIYLSDFPSLISNGSLFAHVFFSKSEYFSSDPYFLKKNHFFSSVVALNIHKSPPPPDSTKNLITGKNSDYETQPIISTTSPEQDVISSSKVNYWKGQLPIRLLHDFSVYPVSQIPPPFNTYYQIDYRSGKYYPPIFFDFFWLTAENLTLINSSSTSLPLSLSFEPISMWNWRMKIVMEQSWKTQHEWGSSTEKNTDDMKKILLETDPILLVVTLVVTLLHMIFEFLAFKNDIQFWKSTDVPTGISIRTIFLIVLLYLIDHEDTSFMIIIGSLIGLIIEIWKITKAAHISIKYYQIKNFSLPYLDFKDKQQCIDDQTAQHDKTAMRYLSYLLFPLVLGYSIYSLLYETHKSWYSWILSSLTGTVYTFGFILMCPQLYMNYKLKSVAHLPWRMLTYKALNTFIDDLFAFIITMPMMHRISCFRDDIVFFIYLYQRWIYRVDYKRPNEYGLVMDQSTPESSSSEKDNHLKTE